MNKPKNTPKYEASLKLRELVFAIAILVCNIGFTQMVTITGQVTSKADGKPLPRTTVSEIDSKTSTVTDEKGYYTIEAPARGTLVFTRSGMKTLEEPVKNRKEISVALEPVTIEPVIDQIIVVIPGNIPWKSTGLVVKPGDIIEFRATGTVCFNQYDQPYSCVCPKGYAPDHPDPAQAYINDYLGTDMAYCESVREDWPHSSLIARDRNGIFQVGSDRTVTGRNGPLEIGINECSFSGTGQYDNSGQFSVVIKVTRGAN